MRREFTSTSGLSLLELLVSLALMVLIGIGISGAFGLGIQLWDRTAVLGENAQEIALRGQLRRFLSQALPPERNTPFDAQFSTQEQGFSFVSLAETPFAPNAAAMRLTVSYDRNTLILRTELLNDDAQPFESWEDNLAISAANVQFDYFDTAGENPAWNSVWTDPDRLPKLVRIRVDEGSVPPWPEFVVRPRLQ